MSLKGHKSFSAHVTDFAAIDRYTLATQDFKEVKVERQSIGYPDDLCKIY